MTKPKSDEAAKKPPQFDDVLKRMLSRPAEPHGKKKPADKVSKNKPNK
jgi:hypothetical protein